MTFKSVTLSWIKQRAVLLLLFTAFLMTSSLVFEQQQTIESQRVLIRDLFHDSVELSQLKVQAQREQAVKPIAEHRN